MALVRLRDQADARVGERTDHGIAAVRAAIIDDDELEIREGLIQDALDRLCQVRPSVIDRHHNRHGRQGAFLSHGALERAVGNAPGTVRLSRAR